MSAWARFRGSPLGWQIAAWALLTPLPVGLWTFARPRGERRYGAALAMLVTAAWLSLIVASQEPDPPAAADAPPPSSPTTTSEPPPTTEPAAATTTTVPSPPPSIVDQLVVAAEASDAGYHRDLFEHWVDADHDGCDTRREILIRQSTSQIVPGPGCDVGPGSGWWLSIYDGYSTDDPDEFDIDHVVALAEAWRSGASTWTEEQRRSFANDLEHPQLIAVTAATNQSKSDRDPASWQPPARDAWCRYATSWVTVKVAWQLTADPAEAKALRNMLAGC